MTEPNTDMQDELALEGLFQEARAMAPVVPAALAARVLVDAQSLQPAPKRAGLSALWQSWGGARGLAGLLSATVVGVWLGVSPPASLPDFAGTLVYASWNVEDGFEDSPYLSGFGWDFEEG